MVHFFEALGQRIALDTPSGAVHVLSKNAYELAQRLTPPLTDVPGILPEIDGISHDETHEIYNELYALYEEGTLFSDDVTYPAPAAGVVKSLCLNISHDCNMRCKYCFAGTGAYERSRCLMSYETGTKAIDFLLVASGGIKNLEIDFFGGEPLLNFDTIKRLVAYGREKEKPLGKHISFTITTNGTLLDDDSIEFINAEMSNVVMSLDGRREVNDRVRVFDDGSGTYDAIIGKYRKLVSERKEGDWYLRGTYTKDNLDFAADAAHIIDAGFENLSVEPVVLEKNDPMAITEEDIPFICDEYEKLALDLVERAKRGEEVNFFHFMIDLDAGPCVYKRIKGCGCGSEYIAVTPEGDIYPCHQFVGFPEYKLGSVNDGSFDRELQKSFAGCNINTLPHCRECWAKYFCGGGCAANSYKLYGRVDGQYSLACSIERKRVECALAIKACLAE